MSKFDDPKRSDDGDEALVIGGALRIKKSHTQLECRQEDILANLGVLKNSGL